MHLQLVRLGTLYFLCKGFLFLSFCRGTCLGGTAGRLERPCAQRSVIRETGGQSAFGGLQGAALLLLPSYDPAALPFDASELTARNRKYLSLWYLLSQYGSMATGFEEGTQLPQRQRWDPKQTT